MDDLIWTEKCHAYIDIYFHYQNMRWEIFFICIRYDIKTQFQRFKKIIQRNNFGLMNPSKNKNKPLILT